MTRSVFFEGAIACEDCSKPLVPLKQHLYVEGATEVVYLLCRDCKKGLRLRLLDMTPVEWEAQDR